jgi:hypothetical protein
MSKAASSNAEAEIHEEVAECLDTESPTVSSAEASNCEDEVRKDDLVDEENYYLEGREDRDYQDGDHEYVYGDYEHGDGDHEYAEGEYESYGYTAAAPRRRRSSLLGHLMAWAGAVNQDHFESEHNNGPERRQENRRASMDTGRPEPRVVELRRRCLSSDELDVLGGDQQEEGSDTEGTPQGRAPRRNSLHAIVERAIAYVNLKPDPIDEDLCPFGTRRDSLF